MSSSKFCVLGAGIVGLTTALSLQEKLPQCEVTIIAEKFNTETTSDVAAGLFCPYSGSFRGPTDEITKDIVKHAYSYYDGLRKALGEHETGIHEIEGYALSNISPDHVKNPLLEEVVPEYRILTPEEIKNVPGEGEWKYGCYFKTLMIPGRRFLPWALKRFQDRGGKVIQMRINHFKDLLPYKFDIVVNCSGIGAKILCDDKDLVPLRGQVIKISAPWEKRFFLFDNDIYIIPGLETTLGGCRNYDNYDLSVDKHISAQIWENCTSVLPSLKESAVIREWTGLRPHRIPIRLEPEIIDIGGEKLKVVHNYGHSSQGITTAPGSAKYAVYMVADLINKSKL